MRSSVLGTAALVLATAGCMTPQSGPPAPATPGNTPNAVPGWLARAGRPPAPETREAVVAVAHAEFAAGPSESLPTKFLPAVIPQTETPAPEKAEPAAAPSAAIAPSVAPPSIPPSVLPSVAPGVFVPTWRSVVGSRADLPQPGSTEFPVWKAAGADPEPRPAAGPTECP